MSATVRGYVQTPWGQVHYRQAGSGGTSLLLLHQAGNSSRMWSAVQGALGERYRTVALDLPGFGGTDPLPGSPTLQDFAEVVLATLDGLGIDRTVMIGYHTGAGLSLALATRQPDRVTNLVLIGIPKFDPTDTTPSADRWRGTMPDDEGAYLNRIWAGLKVPSLEVRNREMADRLAAGEAFLAASGAVRGFDVWGTLPKVQCPALLIVSPEDTMHAVQQEAADLIPDARLVVLEGSALVADAHPEEFVRLVTEFIGS